MIVRAAGESVELDVKESGGDILPSGEWAENFSLLNYEDLTKHYEPVLFKPEVLDSPNRLLCFSVYVYVCVSVFLCVCLRLVDSFGFVSESFKFLNRFEELGANC